MRSVLVSMGAVYRGTRRSRQRGLPIRHRGNTLVSGPHRPQHGQMTTRG